MIADSVGVKALFLWGFCGVFVGFLWAFCGVFVVFFKSHATAKHDDESRYFLNNVLGV
ncbi:hypothetical protein [Helicobacter pylori]|uniref:hypothetical protein n=1 Tax=Helicobacter pylori TaxID=210 RepID=UPI0015E8146A|nr:hypothetical protein [Helicobacter pylori]